MDGVQNAISFWWASITKEAQKKRARGRKKRGDLDSWTGHVVYD